MATILPKSQEWYDLNDKKRGVVVGLHTVKLVSTSDTFRVPSLAEGHATASAKQLERSNDPTVTVTALDSDSDLAFRTIQVAGAVGDEVLIATVHQGSMNFAEDEDAT
jgi:hypothetical protein